LLLVLVSLAVGIALLFTPFEMVVCLALTNF
jgi:hypothetical protein